MLFEELARYDVPDTLFAIGVAMIGPTIIAHGTDEQKDRYLQPMRRGEEIWCQLWSEPDAGSDLAALGHPGRARRRRVRAQRPEGLDQRGPLLRLRPRASSAPIRRVPKHKGISCFIVDLRTPGITIRPLRQITGEAHFNEVFFDDVRIPAANLVGDLHDGWRVARTTLMNERFATGSLGSTPGRRSTPCVELARPWVARPTRSCARSWPGCSRSASCST